MEEGKHALQLIAFNIELGFLEKFVLPLVVLGFRHVGLLVERLICMFILYSCLEVLAN